MSHIPASKMPHAKPHDEPHHDEHLDAQVAGTPPLTTGPEIKPVAADASAADGGKSKPAVGSSVPYLAIAAVGALAIGGIVAALALRPSEAPPKGAKGKAKGRGRKRDVA